MINAVSCPTGRVCYAEVANETALSFSKTTLMETRNSGRTWVSLGTPILPSQPHAGLIDLSCPVTAGCIGIGAINDSDNLLAYSNLKH